MGRILYIFLFWSGAASADAGRLIESTERAFPDVPPVEIVQSLGGLCGGGAEGPGVYCTTESRIYLVDDQGPQSLYTLAHLYGHALQVTYGVADIALAAINRDRSRETELRGMVTRQVECLGGVLVARAGLTLPPLQDLFISEPMTGSHWGRNPVRTGPAVSIGLAARSEWFMVGQNAAAPEACNVGEMSADLIVEADRF